MRRCVFCCLLLLICCGLSVVGGGPAGLEGDTCAAHADCAAEHYCTKNQECGVCEDEDGEAPCELWGDSIDASCKVCGADADEDNPPLPPEQPPEEPAAAAAEMPLLSSTEAFLQQDRQRRSEEYARHAMNMFAAAKQMLLAEAPAPTGRKQRSKKQRQKQETASAYKLGAGKKSLSLEESHRVNMALESAKHSLVAALELGAGEPEVWLHAIRAVLEAFVLTQDVLTDGRTLRNTVFTSSEVSHLIRGVREQHGATALQILGADGGERQSTVDEQLTAMLAEHWSPSTGVRAPEFEALLQEPHKQPDQENQAEARTRLVGSPRLPPPPVEEGMRGVPPRQRLSASAADSPLRLRTVAESLQTRELWPTLVSSLNVLESGLLEPEQLAALNTAALETYSEFLTSADDVSEDADRRNDQFYIWQGGGRANGAKINAPAELAALRRLAIDACSAHVLQHDRPLQAEELGWPEPWNFQLWLAMYANGTQHVNHVHDNSACSGAFYSQVPEGGGSPIIFSDPRGALPSMTSHNPHMEQPLAPFSRQHHFFPKAGDMVLFPSWLVHRVEPQGGETARVAWSFNLAGGVEAWARTAT